MRPLLFVVSVATLISGPLGAQVPPTPPHDSALALETARPAPRTATNVTTVRARLVSSDGRVLIARAGSATAFAWLVDRSSAGRDSSHFTVTLTTAGTTSAVVITDWQGRCLSLTGRESSIPLDFGACDREPLSLYPAADARIAAGQTGFWLLTKLGQVGPTTGSASLLPRSPLKVWFRLEPIT
jgi:hypothetical protein